MNFDGDDAAATALTVRNGTTTREGGRVGGWEKEWGTRGGWGGAGRGDLDLLVRSEATSERPKASSAKLTPKRRLAGKENGSGWWERIQRTGEEGEGASSDSFHTNSLKEMHPPPGRLTMLAAGWS